MTRHRTTQEEIAGVLGEDRGPMLNSNVGSVVTNMPVAITYRRGINARERQELSRAKRGRCLRCSKKRYDCRCS